MATYYWVGGSGTWDNVTTTNWAASSGGAGGAGVPNNTDTAIFDANSGTAATVTTEATATAAVTTVNKADINLSLNGSCNLAVTGTFTFTAGTITLNNNVLTASIFSSSNANTRSIAFGTGSINVSAGGTNVSIWIMNTTTGFTYTGTPTVNSTYAGAGTGGRTIAHGVTGGTESNAVSFIATSSATDPISFVNGSRVKNLNYSGLNAAIGLGNGSFTIYGNLTGSSGNLITAGVAVTFAATSGTQQITTGGATYDVAITQNSPGATVQLQDNLTMGSTRTFTLTAGTLQLVTNTLTCAVFSSNNANTRQVDFGASGQFNLTGNNTNVWFINNSTGYSVAGTNPIVNLTYAGAVGTRGISGALNATEAGKISYNIQAGTDTVGIGSTNAVRNLNFTGFSGTLTNATFTALGNVIFSSGMTLTAGANAMTLGATTGTQQITTNGKTLDFPVIQNSPGATVQFQDNFTMGATRGFTLTAGTLDLKNNTASVGLFASSNTNVRSITFGTGVFNITGNGANIWNTDNATNLTITGSGTVNFTYSGSTGTRGYFNSLQNAFNLNVNAGSDTVTHGNGTYVNNINFTGFSGTLTNNSLNITGNVTLVSGMTLTAGAIVWTFFKTSGTQQITTAGKTIDFPLVFNGIGGTFAFQDALTQGSTRAFTVANGTVQLKNGVTSTVGAFATSGTNQKFLQSTTPGSLATLSQASGTANMSYLTIQDISATGGATWNALLNCLNNQNNRGIYFSYQQGVPLPALPL
jgi:hypothetical protein